MKKIYLSVFLFLVVALTGCKDNERNVKNEPQRVKVELMTVTASNDLHTGRYSGTAEEENGTALSFPVSGTVRTLKVHLGQRVVFGQLIATLDPTSMQSSYNAAKAAFKRTEDTYNRMKELHEKGSLPEIKWVEVQSLLEQARSMQEIAAKNLYDCKLYAPYSGVISEKNIEVGQNVMPGMPVVQLVTASQLKVKIAVPETEITSVSVGQDAKIQVPALGRKVLTGTVDKKGIMANPFSRSYDVKLNVKDTDSGLMPGMVVEVSLLSSAQKTDSQCIIPANIVQLDERNNNFIWVNKNGRATKRIIRCGDYMANGVTVLSGLSAGDQIIVKGQHKVCEGTEVNL